MLCYVLMQNLAPSFAGTIIRYNHGRGNRHTLKPLRAFMGARSCNAISPICCDCQQMLCYVLMQDLAPSLGLEGGGDHHIILPGLFVKINFWDINLLPIFYKTIYFNVKCFIKRRIFDVKK